MKLEAELYIRINNIWNKGIIGKIMSYHYDSDYGDVIRLYDGDEYCFPSRDGFEVSKNLIDLIKVGDYVNGHKIINIIPREKSEDNLIRLTTEESAIYGVRINELEINIKEILTKEQYEANVYKVK